MTELEKNSCRGLRAACGCTSSPFQLKWVSSPSPSLYFNLLNMQPIRLLLRLSKRKKNTGAISMYWTLKKGLLLVTFLDLYDQSQNGFLASGQTSTINTPVSNGKLSRILISNSSFSKSFALFTNWWALPWAKCKHDTTNIFIGPRYTWGPIYGSKCLSVCPSQTNVWLT